MLLATCLLANLSEAVAAEGATASWIWSDAAAPAPRNRFTYFRKMVTLDALPDDATLHLAADSNAHLWINGQIVRRKVARYHEPLITAEVINARPYLHVGKNVVVALHHNWGDIITFQRSANRHAGLWISSSWVTSDATWRCLTAPEFTAHAKQVVGVIGDPRIRYPQIIDGRKMLPDDLHEPAFDDGAWAHAIVVKDGPWPAAPADVETPGQREFPVAPAAVLAAGTAHVDAPATQPVPEDPFTMANRLKASRCQPEEQLTASAAALVTGEPLKLAGKAGETKFITLDFHRPVHGYPFIGVDAPAELVTIDFGYGEIPRSQYDGAIHVQPDGWLNPAGVVGPGSGDRYITRPGRQQIELPDERTARWMTLHVHFTADSEITLRRVGIVSSQYPTDPIGTFACGNKQMQQIVELCLTHAQVSMSDTYVDTPGREDGQWIEDARPRAILTDRWFGDDRLRKLMIRTLAQSQGKDGRLHPFPPSNYPAYPAPYDWSVQWVAMLYDQYLWSGNIEDVRPYWTQLVKYWGNCLSLVRDDGLWITPAVLADIRVGVHAGEKQSSGMVTPWIIERLRYSADLADALGEKSQAAAWRSTADKMADAFTKHHVVPARDGVPAHVADVFDPAKPLANRGYSQAGQSVAIITGLLDRATAAADLAYAFPAPFGSPPAGVTRWNNPTYGYRVLRALTDSGMSERAVAHLIERYAPYLPQHPSNRVPRALQGPLGGPLPEYWVSREDLDLKAGEKNTAQPADETGSHGWGSVPLLWLHDSLLGVRITQPGGAELRIAPEAGGLPYVAGWTMTPRGPVWVQWTPREWRLEVIVPQGVTADVVVPAACKDQRMTAVISPADVSASTPGYFTIQAAGRYVFEAR